MTQVPQRRLGMLHLERELRKQESAAKSVPYISFILTHAALVLFLVVAFFIDHLITSATVSLIVKILLAAFAILLLASEWIYAIISSLRWKKNILLLQRMQEELRHNEEQENRKRQEEVLAVEQLRNRSLQYDVRRLRERREARVDQMSSSSPQHAIRQEPSAFSQRATRQQAPSAFPQYQYPMTPQEPSSFPQQRPLLYPTRLFPLEEATNLQFPLSHFNQKK